MEKGHSEDQPSHSEPSSTDSRNEEKALSELETSSGDSLSGESRNMEKACSEGQISHSGPSNAMKIAIKRYYKQLLEGCGRVLCGNENCASSGKFGKLSRNAAAARAILCLRTNARFCDPLASYEKRENLTSLCQPEELSEHRAAAVLNECRAKGDWSSMREYIERTLSNRDVLLRSFVAEGFDQMSSKSLEQITPDTPSSKITFSEAQPNAPRKRRVLDRDEPRLLGPGSNGHSFLEAPGRREFTNGFLLGERDESASLRSMEYLRTVNQAIAEVRREAAEINRRLICNSASESMDTGEPNTPSVTENGPEGIDEPHVSANENTSPEERSSQMTISDVTAPTKRSSKDLGTYQAPLVEELKNGRCPTDMVAARRCFRMLFTETTDHEHYLQAAMGAIAQLCSNIDFQLQYKYAWEKNPCGIVHILNLIFELPFVGWFEFIEVGFTALCKMCANLGNVGQTVLASVWAGFDADWIQDKVSLIQQALTLRILTVIDTIGSLPRFTDRCEPLPTAVQTLSILYKTVLIKSKRVMQKEVSLLNDAFSNFGESALAETSENSVVDNTRQNIHGEHRSSLSEALRSHIPRHEEEEEDLSNQIDFIDAWTVSSNCLCIPLSEFHNGTLSENFSVDDDFVAYMSYQNPNTHVFSVMPQYSFILSTEVKQRFLILCNKVRQRSERRHAIEQAIAYGTALQPYLRLTVRRDHVVRDALDALAAVALDDVSSFKKQLRVYFDGERALDEGGVSKEFYQLVTQELFCPDYGMFICNQKTGLYWFNSQCTFCDDEYNLIGLLFGLAIYNNILVDVRFPTLLYTKLLARPGVFEELGQLEMDLYKGLTELLNCEDDVESIFCYNFQISYKDAYGNTHTKALIPNGENVPVTNENKREFVSLYADFLLNQLVKRQFEAFKAGFDKVANCSLLRRMCLPHEVEELVCGVLDLNFDLLSQAARYQNGYNVESKTIEDFWTVAKAMSVDEKKMLLQFITGSDRVPVGGLLKLEVIIARNGDDKLRLPTAHTCYNILLLPDYGDLDVMKERLTKAISYSRGFGLQ